MVNLKEKCKALRLALQMSQQEFAKVIGTNQTEISFIERGFIPEDVNKIKAIETLYNLHVKRS